MTTTKPSKRAKQAKGKVLLSQIARVTWEPQNIKIHIKFEITELYSEKNISPTYFTFQISN